MDINLSSVFSSPKFFPVLGDKDASFCENATLPSFGLTACCLNDIVRSGLERNVLIFYLVTVHYCFKEWSEGKSSINLQTLERLKEFLLFHMKTRSFNMYVFRLSTSGDNFQLVFNRL